MTTYRILDTEDTLFAQVWDIYLKSFPLIEQRTLEHQNTALALSEYHLICYLDEEVLVGFIGMWMFDEYSYIEHFAVDSSLRNGGWGSKILTSFMKEVGCPIILEIDDPVNEISRRRRQFYERLGFIYHLYQHPLHVYQPDKHEDALLRIMTYPERIDQPAYDRFSDLLHNVVMKR